MSSLSIGNWTVSVKKSDETEYVRKPDEAKHYDIIVSNSDDSCVLDSERTIGGGKILGYYLTTEKLNAEPVINKNVKSEKIQGMLVIDGFKVEVTNDEEKRLRLFVSSTSEGGPEHICSTNGTGNYKEFDVTIGF
ncbi:hypothetical protein [Photobacterium kishitanii]|uniref:Uncharacterized protein n=1 Tax=Photobacterium kishitanii TaxID=318456 RepID=A0A2T3KLF9_9GAMM|nr:hypothetical protein [Photobacterium kishitanii]PSV00493.1 hypothetical protein C9J27_04995 [Photobacterium kishitanii]